MFSFAKQSIYKKVLTTKTKTQKANKWNKNTKADTVYDYYVIPTGPTILQNSPVEELVQLGACVQYSTRLQSQKIIPQLWQKYRLPKDNKVIR